MKYLDRTIPSIPLANYESRVDEITAELLSAVENVWFFSVIDHGIAPEEIDEILNQSARCFGLPDDVKAKAPFSSANNAG